MNTSPVPAASPMNEKREKFENRLILIGGEPGSGKSTLGRALSRCLKAAYLDLDTISFPFLEHLIRIDHAFKKSAEYRSRHRNREYRSLLFVAAENLALGIDCVAAAPFTRERGDPALTEHLRQRFGIDTPVVGIHITVSPELQLKNLLQRGEVRDDTEVNALRGRLKEGRLPPPGPPPLWNVHPALSVDSSALVSGLHHEVNRILSRLNTPSSPEP